MKTIYQALFELETTHQPAALCAVVRASGSTPCRVVSLPLANNPELEWQPQWGRYQQLCIVNVR